MKVINKIILDCKIEKIYLRKKSKFSKKKKIVTD